MSAMKLFLLSLLFGITNIAIAQDARSILDKAAETYISAKGISANFTLDMKDPKSKITYSYDGKALMQGEKFKIEIPDGITWFDGKTQWVYIKDTEEVNISTPTGDELKSISPTFIFNIYKTGFALTYKGEKRVSGQIVQEIELTSKKRNDINKIYVTINKTTSMLSKIVVVDKSGIENILTINKYQKDINFPTATFMFDSKNYPNVEIIDLR